MTQQFDVSVGEHRTKLFLSVLDCLWRYNDAEKQAVADTAGVHWTTLYNWCGGRTTHPRIDTLSRVADALGFEIVLKRSTILPRPRRRLRLVR